ncbi:MAG: G1 family endopeptidase [Desulfosporosinus sp.]|nr:G1 family endopeptidase [Desulfosporosinus sp.]
MKIMLNKIQIISLTVLIGLGTFTLVDGVPVQPATNNHRPPVYVFAGNSSHKQPIHVSQIQQPQATQATIITTSLPATTRYSENWAGYIDIPSFSGGYTSVSGSWIVPNLSASQENAAAAQWIGLGGSSSNDLLQMGTSEQLEDGELVCKVFWEQLPALAQTVMTVPVGATINANIFPSADSKLTWNLTFTVNGQSETQTIPPVTLTSSYAQEIGTSAEWISEEPLTQNDKLYPFADMGTIFYKSALVNGQALNSAGNQVQPVALVAGNGNILIVPSALGADGESFSTNIPSTVSPPH